MKKLRVLVLPVAIGLAVFTAGCTPTSVEEEYEIQVIDKDDIQHPDERGKDDPYF
ncbi:MAG: hypothetical protein AAF934_09920 [Bacteroidota bacterium]